MSLYKYLSLDDNIKERVFNNLKNHSLWFSNPNDFNDPFDCKLDEVQLHTSADIANYFNHLKNRKYPINDLNSIKKFALSNPLKLRDSILKNREKSINNSGILCMSKSNDNLLMWSHYANAHAGVCLGFTPHEKSLQKGEFFHVPLEVNYIDSYVPTNYCAEKLEAIKYNISTKQSMWSYEQEVRILKTGFSSSETRLRKYIPTDLTGIYFGLATSDMNMNEIKKLCESTPDLRHVTLYKAKKMPASFNIDFEIYRP